jgi:hypothetical protein
LYVKGVEVEQDIRSISRKNGIEVPHVAVKYTGRADNVAVKVTGRADNVTVKVTGVADNVTR